MSPTASIDLLIIGGGPAGLASASVFSRLRRPCMVYDSGLYRNAASPRAHTIVGNESIDPAEYRRKAKAELADAYPWTTFRQGRIVSLVKDGEMFAAEDEHGNTIQARKVVLATGIKDVLPDIPGVAEAWGKRIIHCIYCHGTETAGAPFALLLTHPNAKMNPFVAESWFKLWPSLKHSEVYILTHGMDVESADGLRDSGLEKFMPLIKTKGYHIISSAIVGIQSGPESLTITFAGHRPISVPYMLLMPEGFTPSEHSAGLLTQSLLGADLSSMGTIAPPEPALTTGGLPPRLGDDPRTNVHGLFWAGNAGSAMANVNLAVAQGQGAAVLAGEQLGTEDMERVLQSANSTRD